MNVSIKGINEHEWRIFKAESIKHGLKVGEFFNKIVEEHKNNNIEGNWDKVLFGEKTAKGTLTQSESRKIRSKFRKNFIMRDM